MRQYKKHPPAKSSYNETDIFLHFWRGHTDKADNGYAVYYEKIFNERHPRSILELGIRSGGSLIAWRTLFPEARVVGLDIIEPKRRVSQYSSMDIEWHVCDVTNQKQIDRVLGDSTFDLIVDDASHYYKHQIETFNLMKSRFNHYYVIEDVRWQHELIRQHIQSYGYQVEDYPCLFQPYVKCNKEALDHFVNGWYSSTLKTNVDGIHYPGGEQVTTEMRFYMMKQMT